MINNSEKKITYRLRVGIAVALVSIISFAFYCIYGIKLQPDSIGYITMSTNREPVYPLILAFFRLIFRGSDTYLDVVVVFQNMLAIFAICYSSEMLSKKFSKSKISLVAIYLIHIVVMIICQYASEFHSILSNNILTEGITVSLWLIFVVLMIDVVLDMDRRKFILIFIIAIIMIDTRKQMAVMLIIFFFSFVIIRFIKDEKKVFFRRVLICIGATIISVLVALTLNSIYNWFVHGSFTKNTRDMNLILTTSLYVADDEDASLIEDPVVRELFLETMSLLKNSESNYSYAEPGLRNLEKHYEEHYDIITIETTSQLFVEYAVKKGFKSGIEAEQEADRMSAVIVHSLLMDNIGKYIKVYLASFVHGLIKTVSKRGLITDLYAFVAYLGYVIMMILCLRKRESINVGLVGLVGLIAIVVNVGVVAALIFCDTRYMIYNMSIFYIIGIVMFETVIRCRGKSNKSIVEDRK